MKIRTSERPSRIVTKWRNDAKQNQKELLMVHITFGVAGQNCLGSGICRSMPLRRIVAETVPSSCACKGAVAMVKAERDNTYAFFFIVASMCKKAIKQYFSDDFFTVEADVQIVLGCSPGKEKHIAIPAGIYPIKRLDDYLIVRFKSDC